MPEFDVAGDPALRATLRTARAWGVPLSIFLGRQLCEYDREGRLIRKQDPLWLESDRSAAVALQLYESDLCGGCGQPMSESTLAENEERYQIHYEYCHGCVELEIHEDILSKKDHPGSILRSVSLKDGNE